MCREYGDVDDTRMEVDDECYDGSDSGYSSDGFWSGRLRDREVREEVGCRTVVGASRDLDEGQYRDPMIKTFAWWQAAFCQKERDRVTMKPGHILEEVASDSDGSIGSGGSGQKRDDDGGSDSEEEIEWTGRYGGWKKRKERRMDGSSSPELTALIAGWL